MTLEDLIKEEKLEFVGDLFVYGDGEEIKVTQVDVYRNDKRIYYIEQNKDSYKINKIIELK